MRCSGAAERLPGGCAFACLRGIIDIDPRVEEELTCGKGLAAHSALPRKIAELTDSVGEILALHTEALDLSDENARIEHTAYTELARRHRDVAAQLFGLSDLLASHRDLPMGRHDEVALAEPRHLAAFAQLVRHERELTELLRSRLLDHRVMLDTMEQEP